MPAFRIETGNSVIMIDPFLSGSRVFDGSVEEATAGCTHVALIHGHDDHVGDTVDICKSTVAALIAIFEICMHVNGKGVEKVDPVNTIHANDFSVTFVRADHSSAARVDGGFAHLGNPCGLIVKSKVEDRRVYRMGTPAYSPIWRSSANCISRISALCRWVTDFTMSPRTATVACKRYFNFDTVIPCYYGTFPIIEPDASKFLAGMEGENVSVPGIGEEADI